ncbi:MAG: hypothetical protein IJK51_04635, partial [Bacteroidaceae bacterium]|nr:hypothetical protein [Bacteroidaceae bacterium]
MPQSQKDILLAKKDECPMANIHFLLVSGKNISLSLAPSQPSAFRARCKWQGLGTPQRGRKMSAQGSALGIDMPRQMALCKSKSTKTQSFAPLGRNLHLRH